MSRAPDVNDNRPARFECRGVHTWRVVAYEHQSQVVAYRCRCGAEKREAPTPPSGDAA